MNDSLDTAVRAVACPSPQARGGPTKVVEGFKNMNYKHNKKLTPLAKNLQRKMTKEENHLWYDFLKDYLFF